MVGRNSSHFPAVFRSRTRHAGHRNRARSGRCVHRGRRRGRKDATQAESLETRRLLTLSVEGNYIVDIGDSPQERERYDLTSSTGPLNDSVTFDDVRQVDGHNVEIDASGDSTADYGRLSALSVARSVSPEDLDEDFAAYAGARQKFSDTLMVEPVDASLIGRRATMDITVTINGNLSVATPAPTGALPYTGKAVAGYSVTVESEEVEGSLRSQEGEEITSGNVAFPLSVVATMSFDLGRSVGLSLSSATNAVAVADATRFAGVDWVNAAGTRDATAAIDITVDGISNLRLDDGTPLELSEVDATSESGYDYFGTTGEADVYRWVNDFEGRFDDSANWDRNEVPGDNDVAVFDLPELYTVEVGNQTVDRVLIGGSPAAYVEFEDTLLLAQATNPETPGVVVNQGEFHLLDGVLSSNHALIGDTVASRAVLRAGGAEWQNTGRFVVGGGGEAEILVRGGSRVIAPVTLIGDATNGASGTATVNGTSAGWITDNASVGSKGPGSLVVSRGGLFHAEESVLVGRDAGTSGTVSVRGGDASGTPSRFLVAENVLDIGSQGTGTFDVLDGALVESNATLTRVGWQGPGSLLISGTAEEGTRASRFVARQLFVVGVESPGEVVVEAGGQLDVSSEFSPVEIGAGNQGDVIVRGRVLPSQFVVRDGELILGSTDGSSGNLTIEDGGLVQLTDEAGNLILGTEPGAHGALVLYGDEGILPSTLELRSILEVGAAGTGTVEVYNGSRIQFVNPSVEIVRAGFGGAASIDVSGRDSESGARSQIETGILFMGVNAPGELTIADAGLVDVSGLATIGGSGAGTGRVVVQGANGGLSSELTTAELTIGGESSEEQPAASGELIAEAGGIVRVLDLLTINPDGVLETPTGAVTIGASDPLTGWVRIGSGGTLTGTGTIFGRLDQDGGVDNFAGQVIPGFSPGTMTINGDYRQGPEGALVIEVGGPDPGTGYDQLVVSGNTVLNGTLELQFIDGYTPGPDDTFEFIVSEAVSGQFEEVTVTGLPAGMVADLNLTDNGLTLDVVAQASSHVGGRSFDDFNGDGQRQSNEPWINGWMIHLLDRDGNVVQSQTTADVDLNNDSTIDPETERGWFRFDNLPEGKYYLQQTPQDGWHQTGPFDPVELDVWELDRDHNFTFTGNLWEDWGGLGEKWFWGDGGWYCVTPDGTLYEWDGSPASNLTGDEVTQLPGRTRWISTSETVATNAIPASGVRVKAMSACEWSALI